MHEPQPFEGTFAKGVNQQRVVSVMGKEALKVSVLAVLHYDEEDISHSS